MKKEGINIFVTFGLYSLIALGFLVALIQIINIQFIATPPDSTHFGSKTIYQDIEGIRGGILATDGRYLAVSTPMYNLHMDCVLPNDTLFDNNIDELSELLSKKFKNKSKESYKSEIISARENNGRYYKIGNRLVSHHEMLEIKEYPIFNKGRNKGGLVIEQEDRRLYPYESLGRRTLGYVLNNDNSTKVGIELSCDNVLKGSAGQRPMRRTDKNEWIIDIDQPEIPAVNGLDVVTTIDVDIQDIADRALRNRLSESDEIEGGTVVVMEVATGAIRAMVNLQKHDGGFYERDNYAISRRGEPGSVFKLATLITLLEDKHITLDTEMKSQPIWNYKDRVLTDNYLRDYDRISVQRGFEISSNNVFRILSAKYYEDDPESFIGKLTDLKIGYNFDFDMVGMVPAHIKSPLDENWSAIDLPQIAMGYTVELTPLHTLSFYNAVANNGKMMKPHIIEKHMDRSKVVKEFKPEVIGVICSEESIKSAHKALRGVVENGTGRYIFKDCPVNVSGKTGTAQIVDPKTNQYVDANGYRQHQASFVGFYPSEAPKYSTIVVIYSKKTKKNYYGATWAGPVFRDIAENIYASSPEWNEEWDEKLDLKKVNKEYLANESR